eukprot:CAMPEP_0204321032 /NCGR_PEP_ID=MMETSP0469-20131031/7942_1 /ASSEMBLY_ACC=CAM_ASM_000384 /TAXON_ID=2969 /ORGANISM="Oxyrrhis marina" /LENGTH=294 /DNA_ID=CAMNT_0051302299 /DNA_START=61 /DNA_END=945 /DNA_ORIENTATION=+
MIPAGDDSMQELEHPAVDTLENNDPFIAMVKQYLDRAGAKVDKATLLLNLKEHGKGQAPNVPDEMLDRMISATSVDLFPLAVPMKDNGFHGVTLYCDDKGIAKSLPPNVRAIGLASVLGYPGQNFRGDIFLSRTFDDDDAWRRVDFTLADCSSSAEWVAHQSALRAKAASAPRSLSDLTAQLGGGGPQVTGGGAPPMLTQSALQTGGEEKEFKWSQSEEEVEVLVPVPSGTTKKDVTVKFGMATVTVAVCGRPIVDGSLGGKVVPDGCTWTLVDDALQITLEKAQGAPWNAVMA